MIIDAHQHVWDLGWARYDWLGPDLGEINRTVTQDEVVPQQQRCGVDAVVLVQSDDNHEDTDYMLEVATEYERVVAVVGFAPLADPDGTAETMTQRADNPLLVGVRNLIHDLPDPDFLLRPEVNQSLVILADHHLAFDVVSVLPRHLEHVPALSEQHPELRMVIDHLSKPPIAEADMEPWWSLIERAAENPNVYAKVSGLYPGDDMANWTTESIRPAYERALELFGPGRLMYGGDWPISVLAGGYERVWNGLAPLFAELSDAERDQVLGGTAQEFYRIDPQRLAAVTPA